MVGELVQTTAGKCITHPMPERTRSATRPDAAADRLLCMWSTHRLAVPLR